MKAALLDVAEDRDFVDFFNRVGLDEGVKDGEALLNID